MSNDYAPPARDDRLAGTFLDEERAALRLLMIVRLCTAGAIIAFLIIQFMSFASLFWAALTAAYGLLGVLQYQLGRSRHHAWWHKYVFVTLDLVLVCFIILFPNPFLAEPFSPQGQLRYPNFDYLYVVVALMALSYAPGAVAWAGVVAVLGWGTGVLWVISLPATQTFLDIPNFSSLTFAQRQALMNATNFVDISARLQEFFIILLFAAILAASVWRARRLVRRQLRSERARVNLSRYFSPGLIEELARSDEPLAQVRQQNVAVLFADIVGFTKLSEKAGPDDVIDLLREFHRRMAGAVFTHEGTVDKYIGDAIMATFGTPRTGEQDATNALNCARDMLKAVEDWNLSRKANGQDPIQIGIGLHYGSAVMGDIGDERRLEYAVVGDTVNVASRLEAMTREIGSPLVVSDDTVKAAASEGPSGSALDGLARAGESEVRGRSQPVPVWTLLRRQAVPKPA